MEIDNETTDLIVDVYRKINTLKKILQVNGEPKEKELTENASLLSALLNKMLDDNTLKSVNKNLYRARDSAYHMLMDYNHSHLVNKKPDITVTGCLEDLYNDLSELFVKVNGKDYDAQGLQL